MKFLAALLYLHENLKKIREAQNLTQKAFADIFAVNKTTYANYETGYSSPDFLFIEQVSRTYGVSADELLYTRLADERLNRLSKDNRHYHTEAMGPLHLNEPSAGYEKPCRNCAAKEQTIQAQAVTIAALQSALQMAQSRIEELQKAKPKKL